MASRSAAYKRPVHSDDEEEDWENDGGAEESESGIEIGDSGSDEEYEESPVKKSKKARTAPQAAAAAPLPLERKWLGVTDPAELTKMLEEQHRQLSKLQAELTQSKMMAAAKKAAPAAAPRALTPEAIAANAKKYMSSLYKQVDGQMVYKASLKRQGSGSRISATLPNLSLEEVQAMLGEHFARAKNGPKQMQVTFSGEQASDFGFDSKTLRYGAQLQVSDGFKFTYEKATNILTVSGMYRMCK